MTYSGVNGEFLMISAVRFAIRAMNLTEVAITLVIDDTMEHHSRFCRYIVNVYNLFDHALGTHSRRNALSRLFSCKRKESGFRLVGESISTSGKKEMETRSGIGDQTIAFGFTIHVLLCDSWFCIAPFVTGLVQRKLIFISELKSNNIAEFGVEDDARKRIKIQITKLFEYGKHLCKDVLLGLRSNDEQKPERTLYKTQTINAYVVALGMKLKVIKSIDAQKGCHKIFVTNELSRDAQKALEEYSYRWLIEEFFRNAKQLFGLEGASIRSEQGGAIKLFLVSFADLLVSLQL